MVAQQAQQVAGACLTRHVVRLLFRAAACVQRMAAATQPAHRPVAGRLVQQERTWALFIHCTQRSVKCRSSIAAPCRAEGASPKASERGGSCALEEGGSGKCEQVRKRRRFPGYGFGQSAMPGSASGWGVRWGRGASGKCEQVGCQQGNLHRDLMCSSAQCLAVPVHCHWCAPLPSCCSAPDHLPQAARAVTLICREPGRGQQPARACLACTRDAHS